MDDLTKLDREVADALELNFRVEGNQVLIFTKGFDPIKDGVLGTHFHPSTNPAQAMELLKQFRVDLGPHNSGWLAYANLDQGEGCVGTTPEIAICRAVAAACKGSE